MSGITENAMRARMLTSIILTASIVAHADAQITSPERQHLVAHMDMTASWLIDEVSGLSPAQVGFRPADGAWNILEVVEHLIVVGPIYWQDLQTALKSRPRQLDLASRDADVLWYGIDRTHRESAIPSERAPGQLRDLAAGLAEYRKHHARLLDYVKTTKDDLRSHLVARQGSDAYQWALLISTHEQRHILQIREIKGHPRFPRQ
jgi:DinB superfamily